jgi:TnsA-like endonuclease N terminal
MAYSNPGDPLGQYKPWLTIHDGPPHGLSQRVPARTSPRPHHVLSDGAAGALLGFDRTDEVVDIRAQFPLDRETTRAIAATMAVVHPRDRKTGTDIVMTTDFRLDIAREYKTKRIAWPCQPQEQLDDPKAVEKLKIARRNWSGRNVLWFLSNEAELSPTRILNWRWLAKLRPPYHVKQFYPNHWQDGGRSFRAAEEQSADGTRPGCITRAVPVAAARSRHMLKAKETHAGFSIPDSVPWLCCRMGRIDRAVGR